MSETSKAALRYVAEVTPGTTPANPTFQDIVYVSSALAYAPDTEADDSISPDRQVLDLALMGYGVEGDNEHRFRYGALDDLFEAAFYGVWSKRPEAAVSGYNATTGTFTIASGGASYLQGHLILASGFAIAGNNKAWKVSAAGSGTTVVIGANGATDTTGRIKIVGIEGAAGDITTLVTDKSINTTALNFVNLGVVPGMWLKVGGTLTANRFAASANNDWVRVASVTATKIVLDSVPLGWVSDTGAGKAIRLFMGDFLRNGSVRRAFTFEREYEKDDGSKMYRYFRGCFLDMTLDMSAREMISVSFGVMGISASEILMVRETGATTIPAIGGEVLNTSSNIGQFRMGGIPLAAPNFILGFSAEINNNHRGREAVGTASYVDVRSGRFELTGSAETYLGDAAMVNALMRNQATGLALPILASDKSSGYHLDIPRLKFTDGGEEVPGADEDIAPDLEYQGLKDPVLGYTAQMSKYAYLEF